MLVIYSMWYILGGTLGSNCSHLDNRDFDWRDDYSFSSSQPESKRGTLKDSTKKKQATVNIQLIFVLVIVYLCCCSFCWIVSQMPYDLISRFYFRMEELISSDINHCMRTFGIENRHLNQRWFDDPYFGDLLLFSLYSIFNLTNWFLIKKQSYVCVWVFVF